jgi:hypothetical protein
MSQLHFFYTQKALSIVLLVKMPTRLLEGIGLEIKSKPRKKRREKSVKHKVYYCCFVHLIYINVFRINSNNKIKQIKV